MPTRALESNPVPSVKLTLSFCELLRARVHRPKVYFCHYWRSWQDLYPGGAIFSNKFTNKNFWSLSQCFLYNMYDLEVFLSNSHGFQGSSIAWFFNFISSLWIITLVKIVWMWWIFHSWPPRVFGEGEKEARRAGVGHSWVVSRKWEAGVGSAGLGSDPSLHSWMNQNMLPSVQL